MGVRGTPGLWETQDWIDLGFKVWKGTLLQNGIIYSNRPLGHIRFSSGHCVRHIFRQWIISRILPYELQNLNSHRTAIWTQLGEINGFSYMGGRLSVYRALGIDPSKAA